jgi:hypothetical protein
MCAFLFFADFPNRLCQYCKQSQNPTCLIACCYVCLSCVPRGRDDLLNDVIQCYAAEAQQKLVQFGAKLRTVFFNLFSWWAETTCLELRLIDKCMWSVGGAIPEGTRSAWQETCPCVTSITDVGDYRLRSFSGRGQVVILSCRTVTLHHHRGFVDTRFTLRLGTWYFERFRRFLCPVCTQWIIQLRFTFLMFIIQLPVVTHSPAGNISDTGCETTQLRC